MPDHGFYGPKGAIGRGTVAPPELGRQGLNLGRVTNGGRGAMRLNQTDGFRVDIGVLIGARQGKALTLNPRGENTKPLAVRGDPDPTHQRIDTIARGLGIRQTFDAEQAHAFAQQCAIGLF